MSNDFPPLLEVRELRQNDIPTLAETLTLSPDDGTLYQFPTIQQQSEKMCYDYIKWLRNLICDNTTLVRVATIPGRDGEGSRVIGFSCWLRREPTPKNPKTMRLRKWHNSSWLDGMYGKREIKISGISCANRFQTATNTLL